jgi:hypothetical protein
MAERPRDADAPADFHRLYPGAVVPAIASRLRSVR